jgi:hypothetical protein
MNINNNKINEYFLDFIWSYNKTSVIQPHDVIQEFKIRNQELMFYNYLIAKLTTFVKQIPTDISIGLNSSLLINMLPYKDIGNLIPHTLNIRFQQKNKQHLSMITNLNHHKIQTTLEVFFGSDLTIKDLVFLKFDLIQFNLGKLTDFNFSLNQYQNIVDFIHSVNKKIIIEEVDTEQDLELMHQIRVDKVLGKVLLDKHLPNIDLLD